MENRELIPHLFRTEFRKITAVLCKHFGLEFMETAEDIAGETFVSALETWPHKGIPENPAAWLYTVAKNKTKNHLARNSTFSRKISILTANSQHHENEIDLSDQNITDSQLQMLFALCHPSISPEAQIGLSLRILCGFGIEEIANAFLTSKETINKRLLRAREKLRAEHIGIEVPPGCEIDKRLETVLTTLYLLFSEGYYSESNNAVLRKDLCLEAMRLAYLLKENTQTNQPVVDALLALMCFHSSRFEARKNDTGELVLYKDQDETLWNHELIVKGTYFLQQASRGNKFSRYHLEANIAWWHTIKHDSLEKWESILHLYNQLLVMEYTPVAALNRTFALSKVKGEKVAIREAEKLDLTSNHYYFTLLDELYKNIDKTKARENLGQALALAKTDTDRRIIQAKMEKLSL